MKKTLIILSLLIPVAESLQAQPGLDSLLSTIVVNNSSLSSLRKYIEAEKRGNRRDLLPPNPESEFNYLWGDPFPIGNRTDIRITQSFDFPTAYVYKNRISGARNDQSELTYQKELQSLLLQARLLYIDLICTDRLKQEMESRIHHAATIASSFRKRFENGETGIIEHNKARLNLLNLEKVADKVDLQRKTILAELKILNGGIPLTQSSTNYVPPEIPENFDEWYKGAEQTNPVLAWFRKEAEISLLNEKLASSMGLPKITTGYMSEKVVGERFQGITAGITIPLWENKNQVKYARATSAAVQSAETSNRLILYHQLMAHHEKASAQQKLLHDYRLSLKQFDNTAFLETALKAGEIDLTEYLTGVAVNYEGIDKLLEMEREYYQTVALLYQYSSHLQYLN